MRIIVSMSDDRKPNPMEDVSKGLGLLFRAAKTTVERLPTDKLEDFVTEGAKEVGRALETVGDVIEREVLHTKPHAPPHAPAPSPPAAPQASPEGAPPPAASAAAPAPTEEPAKAKDAPSADEPPKGPRIV